MPPRRLDPGRVLPVLNKLRAELGLPPYEGPNPLNECVRAVLDAYESGRAPGRDAERAAVRHALDLLALRAPGRSVEVRVPPYAAIQCVEGPGHTRGTPPNVVEMDPRTWLELTAGHITWDDALGGARVSAAGTRADLSPYLPIMR